MDRSSTLRASTNSPAETLQYWLITGQSHAIVQRFRVRLDVPAERRVDVRMSSSLDRISSMQLFVGTTLGDHTARHGMIWAFPMEWQQASVSEHVAAASLRTASQ